MGKHSTRENKNIFQQCREAQGLTREKASISKRLDEVSLDIDALNLWVEKTASEHNLNMDLLNEEKEKLK